MTDEDQIRRRAVSAVINGVARKTALILLVAAAAAVVFTLWLNNDQRWWFIPESIVFGGVLGLLNFRWLALAVERVYLRKGATPALSNLAAVVIGLVKLSVIFIVLFIVIKWRIIHILGLVAGLSLCFLAILWEGVTAMKRTLKNG